MPGLLPKNIAQIKRKIPIYKVYSLGVWGLTSSYTVYDYN